MKVRRNTASRRERPAGPLSAYELLLPGGSSVLDKSLGIVCHFSSKNMSANPSPDTVVS
jgi:hypothetical protein